MTKMCNNHLWITTFILLLLFGWFIVGLNLLYMRPDEHLVYQHTSGSLTYTVWYQARQDVQAPLWHSFFWAWRQLVGDSEFAGRYQGLLFSTLTLSMLYLLVKRWFKKVHYGWFAMLVLSTNAYFFTYAFEIRPYPLVLLAATLCMWLFHRWLQQPSPRRTVFYGLSLALLAYVHYFLAFLVIAQGIYLLAQKPSRTHWIRLFWAGGLALIVWLPWTQTFLYQVNQLREIDGTLGIGSTTQETSLENIIRLVRRATNGIPYLWAVLLLTGVWFVRRSEFVLLFLWGIGVPIIAFTVNTFASVYDQRYIVYAVLGLGLSVGIALAALPMRWLRWTLLIGFVGVNLWLLPTQLPDRLQYRRILQNINANGQMGDVLVFDNAKENVNFIRWQIDQYLAPTLLKNQVATIEQARDHRRVWYISGDITDSDTRSRFRELERTHPLVMVTGRCQDECFIAQLLEGAPSQHPLVVFESEQFGDAVGFYGVDVDRVTDEAIEVRLWWMVEQIPTLNYSMSLRLTDNSGTMIASQDSPPIDNNGETLLTTQMEAGRMLVDHRHLTLSSNIRPGQYNLQLIVYEPIAGDTLTADEKDVIRIQTITIP